LKNPLDQSIILNKTEKIGEEDQSYNVLNESSAFSPAKRQNPRQLTMNKLNDSVSDEKVGLLAQRSIR